MTPPRPHPFSTTTEQGVLRLSIAFSLAVAIGGVDALTYGRREIALEPAILFAGL